MAHPTRGFKTPEELEKVWKEYKRELFNNEDQYINDGYHKVPMTLKGFCSYCKENKGNVESYFTNQRGYFEDFKYVCLYIKSEIKEHGYVPQKKGSNSRVSTHKTFNPNSKRYPNGFIYVIQLIGFDIYKIGVSNKPERRISDIDGANPFGVDLVGTFYFDNVYSVENYLHKIYKGKKFRREWFKLTEEDLIDLINEIDNYGTPDTNI